jgi:Lrp/AsnC family transcriptional regulator for asnA, asnC and gidA
MFSDQDLSIISHLSRDPRCSVTRLAETLGMPESTVRHRLRKILGTGAIEFAAIVNPLEFGFHIWEIIEIQVDLDCAEAAAEKLASLPEVYFVGLTTGGYDILVGAVFRSTDDLRRFVTEQLAIIPGIQRTATSNVLKVFKRTSAFGVLQGPATLPEADGEKPRGRRRRKPAADGPAAEPAPRNRPDRRRGPRSRTF